VRTVHIVGPGRAGRSLAGALEEAGWPAPALFGRDTDFATIGEGVDLVVIATPDAAIAAVADAIEARPDVVVVHLAGSLGLAVLGNHPRRACLHPLVALPDGGTGAARLKGAWFALSGDPLVEEIVAALGGRSFTIAEEDRARYHAAAVVASNHLVAVLGQAERIAASAGVPFEAFMDLVRVTVDNVDELGPAAALTGPAARGDEATIRRHLDAIEEDERPAYEALAAAARRLAGRPAPTDE
jgi:predicted short-subunit dehydrogenase-like oxidoreductase (DUF2520 family)